MKKITKKQYWESINRYKKRFISQKKFTPSKNLTYINKNHPDALQHSIRLNFTRSKFIFIALLEQIEKKNAFSAYCLLKAYWECVALMGYITIKTEKELETKNYEEIWKLSRKIAMGGKKYPTTKMILDKGSKETDYRIPNVLTMMEFVDKDFNKKFPDSRSDFKENYDQFIAEISHPGWLSMSFSLKIISDDEGVSSVNKSWNQVETKALLNYVDLASILFFYYWDRIDKTIEENFTYQS